MNNDMKCKYFNNKRLSLIGNNLGVNMKLDKTYISVGEPWDFTSPDGDNIINGHVIKIINSTCLVFKANYTLNFLQHSGNIFVLFPRYTGEDFYELQNGGNYITVNGKVLIESYTEDMTETQLKEKSKFVIIGCIRT